MLHVKICGLSRPEDIDYVNEARPDYCGFIINFPKSCRNVSIETLRALRKKLVPEVTPVGVFVNSPVDLVAGLLNDGTIAIAQLHGTEDAEYIASLRNKFNNRNLALDKALHATDGKINGPLWRAFQVRSSADVKAAVDCDADFVLLDAGQGNGKTFDWSLLTGFPRPFGLAGGLDAHNIEDALTFFASPSNLTLVDVSSGVESSLGIKDRDKILEFMFRARHST